MSAKSSNCFYDLFISFHTTKPDVSNNLLEDYRNARTHTNHQSNDPLTNIKLPNLLTRQDTKPDLPTSAMASLTCLPYTLLPIVSPSSSSTSSSCSAATCLVPSNPKRCRVGLQSSRSRQRFGLSIRAAVDGVSAMDEVSGLAKDAVDDVTSLGRSPLKLKLLVSFG